MAFNLLCGEILPSSAQAQLTKRVYLSLKSYVCFTDCHALYYYNKSVATSSQNCSWKDGLKNANPCHNELFSTSENNVIYSQVLFPSLQSYYKHSPNGFVTPMFCSTVRK